MVKPEVLMRYIRIFSELGSQMRYATQKRILLEIAIIKLCRPQMERDYGSLTDRMDSIERRLESGEFAVAAQAAGSQGARTSADPAEKPALPKAIPEDIQQIIKNWRAILSETGGVARQYLNKAIPTLGADGDLLLVFDDATAYAYLNEDRAGSMSGFRSLIEARAAKEVAVALRLNESGRTAKEVVPDLRAVIHMDIEEENFDE